MILCPKLSYKIDSVIFLTSIMIIIPLSVSLSIEKGSIMHYSIPNNRILKSNSSVFPRSEGYNSQYPPCGVYGLIAHEINELTIIFFFC